MTTSQQALALFSSAPPSPSVELPKPDYLQRLILYRLLISASAAGAGYGITIGVDQAKVLAAILDDHQRLLSEVSDLRELNATLRKHIAAADEERGAAAKKPKKRKSR